MWERHSCAVGRFDGLKSNIFCENRMKISKINSKLKHVQLTRRRSFERLQSLGISCLGSLGKDGKNWSKSIGHSSGQFSGVGLPVNSNILPNWFPSDEPGKIPFFV